MMLVTLASHYLIFSVPELPTGYGLTMQHFESAFDGGSETAPLAHELCDFGVVDEVVEQMSW